MKAEEAAYVATAAAQLLMSRERPINADGKWGNFTQGVYAQISPGLRTLVDETVKRIAGVTPADLAVQRQTQKKAATMTKVDRSDMKALISRVAAEEGVPEEAALKIANLESRFNPNAVSPTGAKGLFQLTSIAVKDLAQRGGFVIAPSDILDPEKNARAGIKYMKLAARDVGARLDETAKIYMAFNIGPTGAKYVLKGQPELAEKQIRLQAYGPPQQYAARLTAAVQSA